MSRRCGRRRLDRWLRGRGRGGARGRGTTLIELMAVVGIISVLASLAIGFSANYRRQEALKEVSRNILAGLAQGRAEAVRRSTRVHVDFVAGSAIQVRAYTDLAGNFAYDPPGDGLPIFLWPGPGVPELPSPAPTLAAPALVAANGHLTAIFDYQGQSVDRTGAPLAALVCVHDVQLPAETRAVQLSAAGAARVLAPGQARALCP